MSADEAGFAPDSDSRRRWLRFAAVLHVGYETPAIVHGPVPRNSAGLSWICIHRRSV